MGGQLYLNNGQAPNRSNVCVSGYQRSKENFALSNFDDNEGKGYKFLDPHLGELWFPTSEHYLHFQKLTPQAKTDKLKVWQDQKSPGEILRGIRNPQSQYYIPPEQSAYYVDKNNPFDTEKWDVEKKSVQMQINAAKYQQSEKFRESIHKAIELGWAFGDQNGPATIIEDTSSLASGQKTEEEWGTGPAGNGKNILGNSQTAFAMIVEKGLISAKSPLQSLDTFKTTTIRDFYMTADNQYKNGVQRSLQAVRKQAGRDMGLNQPDTSDLDGSLVQKVSLKNMRIEASSFLIHPKPSQMPLSEQKPYQQIINANQQKSYDSSPAELNIFVNKYGNTVIERYKNANLQLYYKPGQTLGKDTPHVLYRDNQNSSWKPGDIRHTSAQNLLQEYQKTITIQSQNNIQKQSSQQQVRETGLEYVTKSLKNITFGYALQSVQLDRDKNVPHKHVVKINFNTRKEAEAFRDKHFSQPTPSPIDGNTVIIGEDKARYFFKIIQIENYGRHNPRDTMSVLIDEFKMHQSAQSIPSMRSPTSSQVVSNNNSISQNNGVWSALKINPFEVNFKEKNGTAISAEAQAKTILNEVSRIHKEKGAKVVGITYSANQAQTEEILKTYANGGWKTNTQGSNQAAVIQKIEELLATDEYKHLQNVYRTVPITTMKYQNGQAAPADNSSVEESLRKASEFMSNGGVLLGWKNQTTPQGLAIGGGISDQVQTPVQKKMINDWIQNPSSMLFSATCATKQYKDKLHSHQSTRDYLIRSYFPDNFIGGFIEHNIPTDIDKYLDSKMRDIIKKYYPGVDYSGHVLHTLAYHFTQVSLEKREENAASLEKDKIQQGLCDFSEANGLNLDQKLVKELSEELCLIHSMVYDEENSIRMKK
ncbi:DUF1768 domain-containing protein [Legionella erythra]|uniref:Uncharacterized protein n=1 Tax=Legionella erythra TaxID=448 RepID=A0A0W0TLR1_LEGER|nr:DUF1768 domain-containing protein [Legionella erythra]KTC96440.1 hypothetical protein Lery_1836 [Legionella erythra]